jgi:hypothetical protein
MYCPAQRKALISSSSLKKQQGEKRDGMMHLFISSSLKKQQGEKRDGMMHLFKPET